MQSISAEFESRFPGGVGVDDATTHRAVVIQGFVLVNSHVLGSLPLVDVHLGDAENLLNRGLAHFDLADAVGPQRDKPFFHGGPV